MSIVQSGVQAISVLIDPWWNVNLEEERWKSTGVTVLIDTWWNVNEVIAALVVSLPDVLIDTWWNVNSIAFTFAFLKPKF